MNVAFCINRGGLRGLGVTLTSLFRNCTAPNTLQLWFLCAGLREPEKRAINRLLQVEGFRGRHEFLDFDPALHFGSLCSLHGDWTTYGRLLLADLIPEDRILYLDSDLVIEVNVLEVQVHDFNGHPLAAVGGGQVRHTLGQHFYIHKLGLAPDTEYFNAGVLLLNLREWRAKHIQEQCLKLARQYPLELPSHDQSLLNVLLAGNFSKLPAAFNCEWLAHEPKPTQAESMILHFVGSPKPWDPFGSLIHNGYETWRRYADPEWEMTFGQLSTDDFQKIWRLRRSYARSILHRLRSWPSRLADPRLPSATTA